MLVSTVAIAVLGTALVAAEPVQWGRLAGIAVLLAGMALMGVEMILVNVLRHRERKHADALEMAQTRLDEATGLEAVLEQGVLAMAELLEVQAGVSVVSESEDAEFEFVTAWGFSRDVLDRRTGDLVGAEFLGETIRRDIEMEKLTFDSHDLGEINLSIGVATMPGHASTIEDVIKAADEALYVAKSHGRNRVITAPGPPGSSDGRAESRDRLG